MIIFHNPRCRKSRETLTLLEEKGIDPIVVEYLTTPPSVEELTSILLKLGKTPLQIIRKTEAIYKEQFKGKKMSDEEWIKVMVQNPKLIERPIVINGNKAAIGRPIEDVIEII